MEEVGEDAVEAEAVVPKSTVVMRSVRMGAVVMMSVHMGAVVMMSARMGAVVLVEEMMTGITVTMTGAGGLEAEVQGVRGDEVEVREEGGTEVQSEKVVLKEGLRLSNGTGKRRKQTLVIRSITITTMMTGVMTTEATTALHQMEINIVTLSSINSSEYNCWLIWSLSGLFLYSIFTAAKF